TIAQQVVGYLEAGGSLYLEGGDALIRAGDLADGAVLYQLIGIDSVADGGNENVIDSLLGQPGSIAEGMVFTSSNQVYSQYIDKYFVGSGMPVFEETGYCTVAVQNVGNSGQRTICASYSLACLADGPPPSTRQELFGAIMGFLLKDTKIPVITSIHPPAVFRGRTTYVTLYGANLDDVWEIQVDSATATNLIIDEAQGAWCAFDLNVPLNIAADTLIITAVASEFSATHGLALVDLPVAIADTFETSEDTAAVCAVLDNDTHPAGDPLKIVAVTDGGHGSVSIGPDSTTAIYDPVANYCGPDSFTYTAADTNNENISATVYMTVWPVNDRPEITSSDSVLATEGEPFVYLIEAWDVDNDSLIYDAFNLQSWLDIVDTATVSGIPDVGDTTVSFHVRASDGLLADTLEVRLLIHGMNHPPIAIADTICTLEDSAIVIPVLSNDVDIDGDTLKVVAVDSARHGLLSIGPDSLNLRYQPTADYHGADTAAYTIADGAGNSAAAFVFITVHPVNDAPGPFHLLSPIKSAAITITKQNVHDTLVFVWQPANDIDGDSVTYSFIATPDLAAAMGEFSPGSAVYLAVPMETLAVNIQADGSSGRIGTWYVTAADTALTTASANGPFIISISVEQLAAELPGPLPTEFTLGQNYPNPFNPATTMEFGLPLTGPVQLSIYDLRGRLVRRLLDRNLQPGYYQVVWDGREQTGAPAASGIYLGLLRAGQAEKRIKLVLLR
ncbi:MAG: tandem-95 repeat protein, partial [Candidatus Marinimicrobia bacterium]|nr:tandem-95 repeat protein [Candidatus Neomarinimicrobiota bacterium]